MRKGIKYHSENMIVCVNNCPYDMGTENRIFRVTLQITALLVNICLPGVSFDMNTGPKNKGSGRKYDCNKFLHYSILILITSAFSWLKQNLIF